MIAIPTSHVRMRALLLALLTVLFSADVSGVDYLSFREALTRAFPDSGAVEAFQPALDQAAQRRLAELAAISGPHAGSFGGAYIGHSSGAVDGIAYIDHVIGRTEYITYCCVFSPQGAVREVMVMSYREPVGDEVRHQRWLQQFSGRSVERAFHLKREIDNIAGATMSCRAITGRVRWLTHLHALLVAPRLQEWMQGRTSPPARGNSRAVERSQMIADAMLRVRLPAGSDPAVAERLLQQAMQLDARLNTWRDDGPLATLNATGQGQLPPEALRLLQQSAELHRRSRGIFDPSIRPLLELWWQAAQADRMPTEAAIADARQRVGFDRLYIDPTSGSVQLPQGMRLDFGGLRKGAILDRLAATHQEPALLEWGGSTYLALGEAARIAVRHPVDPERLWGQLQLPAGQALAVSGSQRQRFTIAGTAYAHLIDPRSGRPGDPERWAAVIAADAATADALATACCLLEPSVCRQVIEEAGAAALLWDGSAAQPIGDWPDWLANEDAAGD